MASLTLEPYQSRDWLEEQSGDSLSDDNISLLLEEVRANYDVNTTDIQQDQSSIADTDEAGKALNEAVDNLQRPRSSVVSCVSCSEAERVVDVNTFAKGQHLSMPGQHKTKYDRVKRKLSHVYKHHAIVTEVKSCSGMKAELVLIHFVSKNNKINIYKTTETFDLGQDEIYHVEYKYPRYGPEEIVWRAESILPENGSTESQFDSYDLAINNCEHFATWCVVGEGESIQAQGYGQMIVDGLRKIFGVGSMIAKGLVTILFNSADEIAAALTSAINVPEIVLGTTAGIYLLYCIVMTVLHVKDFMKGHMCRSCLKQKLLDLWIKFGVFGVTSVLTFVILHFALPILGVVGIPLVILLILLSVVLQWSVPKIRQVLQSPLTGEQKRISHLSEINIGDLFSFTYYGFEHVAIATEVNEAVNEVRCVHYALPSLFGTRTVSEETFTLNPTKDTVKRIDCSHLQCRPRHEVVELVRKRVGEKKWSPLNRSDHVCYWAKTKALPRGISLCSDDAVQSDSLISTTAFIREEDVHLMTDLEPGDVVEYYRKGILVGLKSLDNNYGRRFEVEIIEYTSSWYIRQRRYTIDLNEQNLKVSIYHPAHCYSMATRVKRALALKDKKGETWTTQSFIEDCIMRPQS